MQLLDYSMLEESRAVFRTFFLGRALKESLTVQKALSASNSQRCNTFGTTVVSSVLFQDTAETEVKKKQQGWPIVQKFLMWKMFSNKKWVLNHVSGVEVSEEERCNRELHHEEEHREEQQKQLLSSKWRAQGQPLKRTQNTPDKNQTYISHQMNCATLPHASWTQSLQRLKIKWTNLWKGKKTEALQGDSICTLHARAVPWQRLEEHLGETLCAFTYGSLI